MRKSCLAINSTNVIPSPTELSCRLHIHGEGSFIIIIQSIFPKNWDWNHWTFVKSTCCKPRESVSLFLFYRLYAIRLNTVWKIWHHSIFHLCHFDHRERNIFECTFASIILYRYFYSAPDVKNVLDFSTIHVEKRSCWLQCWIDTNTDDGKWWPIQDGLKTRLEYKVCMHEYLFVCVPYHYDISIRTNMALKHFRQVESSF